MADSLLASMLLREEAFRSQVYDDATGRKIVPGSHVLGHPTIGIGRALDVNGVSLEEAGFLLQSDIRKVNGGLALLPWFLALDKTRQDCITAMAFQMGISNMQAFGSMIACIRLQDYASAAEHMLKSKWAAQTPARVQRMAAMMRTGTYT